MTLFDWANAIKGKMMKTRMVWWLIVVFIVVVSNINGQESINLNDRIVYLSDSYSQSENLFSMKLDGTDITNITNVLGNLQRRYVDQASCSPHNSNILFVTGSLHKVNFDGSNLTNIFVQGSYYSVAHSNDGTQMVFEGSLPNEKVHEIYISDAQGNNIQQVTSNGLINLDPAFSSDDEQIVFIQTNSSEDIWKIIVVNKDGSNAQEIYQNTSPIYDVSWSPVDSRILFAVNENDDANIFTINSDGANLTQLTTNSARNRYAQWSPDGQYIVFSSTRDKSETYQIYTMKDDGGDPTKISDNKFNNKAQCWISDPQPCDSSALDEDVTGLVSATNTANGDPDATTPCSDE